MYYYDAVTRETSWVRPTSANVITQQELEALAAANAAEKAETSKPTDVSDAGVCLIMSLLLGSFLFVVIGNTALV